VLSQLGQETKVNFVLSIRLQFVENDLKNEITRYASNPAGSGRCRWFRRVNIGCTPAFWRAVRLFGLE
jgi:hypothetical protein